jgi:hypothetical protein
VDLQAPDPARIAQIDALLDRADSAPERQRLLFERGELLVLLGRAEEAIETLERITALATPGSPPEIRIGAARALRMWIALSEDSAGSADLDSRLECIDAALAALPAEPRSASQQTAGDLLVEKALLLDRAGRDADVDGVLDEMIGRFADTDDPIVALAAVWALRNRIERLLEEVDGDGDGAIAAAERLAALYARVWNKPTPDALGGHVAAVWGLLNEHGLESTADGLIEGLFNRMNAAADQLLADGRARSLIGTLLAAHRLRDANGAEQAMSDLHALGEPALQAIDDAVATRTVPIAILLLQKVPLLVELDRTDDARATLDRVDQLLAGDPAPELRDAVHELRAELAGA